MLRYLAAVSVLTLMTPALADGVSYDYIEGSYERVEFDDDFSGDFDGDGFGIAGSFALTDQWHLFAGYSTAGLDFDVDLDQLRLGGGFHTGLTNNVDLVAELAYVRLDASTSFGSVDDDGFGLSVGVRGMSADRLELAAFVDYLELDDSGDDTSLRGEAWYNFTETFALGFTASAGDDVTQYGIGGRVFFD